MSVSLGVMTAFVGFDCLNNELLEKKVTVASWRVTSLLQPLLMESRENKTQIRNTHSSMITGSKGLLILKSWDVGLWLKGRWDMRTSFL